MPRAWLVLVVVASVSGEVRAESGEEARRERDVEFQVMPGDARAISHGLSASRDTALFDFKLTPYSVITAGGDLALFGLRFRGVTLRLAIFGLLELQSGSAFDFGEDGLIGIFPVADVALWRGVNGASLGLSLDDIAERRLGPRGQLEVVLSFRHESEHFTGPGEPAPSWVGVPNMGDLLMPEVGLRLPLGPVDLELRVQLKVFFHRRYLAGPGADLIARWRAHRVVHPFLSCFFEYLIGGEGASGPVPDNYLFRALLGVLFPGRLGDLQLFLSIAQGHDKGLLAFTESFRFGGGFRIAFPPVDQGWRSRRD